MAERDRVRRALGGQDAGEARHLDHPALRAAAPRGRGAWPRARCGCGRAPPPPARSRPWRTRRPCAPFPRVEVAELRALERARRPARGSCRGGSRARARPPRRAAAPPPARRGRWPGRGPRGRRSPCERTRRGHEPAALEAHARGQVRLRAPSGSGRAPGARPRPSAARPTRAPCMRRRAGRTKRSKVTCAETGLPGSPKTSLSPRRPKTRGAPGLIATRVKSRPTSKRASTGSTRSKAPSETPPERTSTSEAKPSRTSAAIRSDSSGTTPRSAHLGPRPPRLGDHGGAVAVADAVRPPGGSTRPRARRP